MDGREPTLEEMKARVYDYYQNTYKIKFRSDISDSDIIDLYKQLKKFGISVARFNLSKRMPPSNLVVLHPELEK